MDTLGSEQLAKPDAAAPARSNEKSLKPSTAKKRPFGILPSRDLLSKVALELFIVFVGVSAAFALENFRVSRADDGKRQAVYRALDRELTQMAETHGPRFHAEIERELNAWDTALARGQKPVPPAFRIPGAERPPTGVWDAAVATGSIELIDTELFY